jgi:tripartite-type tricarboxylate transporter receptor subunit TctC
MDVGWAKRSVPTRSVADEFRVGTARRARLCPPYVAVLLAVLLCGASPAVAEYPERPIHIIVPLPAGSLSDNVARILAAKLGERLRQQVIVENRVGGSTVVASEAVARAAPDGYTMEIINSSSHATVAAVMAKLPFDPVTDFAPVGMIGVSPFVLVTSNKVPASTVRELVAVARRAPGTLTYASAGIGSIAHLATELLEKNAGIKLTHVPYRGTSQSVFDLMEGRIDLQVGTLSGTEPHIRAGKLRALAVMSARRLEQLPDVPTIAEAGYPGVEVELWSAIVLPAGARSEIITRLNRDLRDILEMPDVRDALKRQGLDPQWSTPDAAAAVIKTDVAKWNEVIRRANLVPK